MSQRTRAGLLALCLLAVLWGTAVFVPLPYVTYRPGPTVDILAETDGEETVQVTGHKAYYDDGELRMTTVFVSSPEERVGLARAAAGLLRPRRRGLAALVGLRPGGDRRVQRPGVRRRDGVVAGHRRRRRADRARRGGRRRSSRSSTSRPGLPAEGKLEVRDVLLKVGGTDDHRAPRTSSTPSTGRREGEPIAFVVRRGEEGGERRGHPAQGRRRLPRRHHARAWASTSRSG